METGLIQQGDVLFHRLDKLPAGLAAKEPEGGQVIFAYGEATGHSHSAAVLEATGEDGTPAPNLRMYMEGETLYVEVLRETRVVHPEHKPVTLSPGVYRRGIVREVDPFADEVRRVMD
jgi:hypothetical protein